ncbi:MAG TPA: PAS domain S-box protein, partial [Flavisolibacter sp.]
FPQLKTSQVFERFHRVLKGETIFLKDDKDILTGGVNDLLMVPVKDEYGQIISVLNIIHDTTKEFELRQQLTDRLHFIEKLLEASVDRVIVLDRNMNYLYWNRRAEQYYGIGKENIIGKNILEMFPGFIEDPSYGEFRKVFKGETVHIPASKNLEDKKGYFETYLIPIKDDTGLVTGVLWIVHDLVGEYRLAQQQRKANHILESINESYVEVDFDGRVIYMNPQAEKFWNVSEADILGKTLTEFFPGAREFETVKALESALAHRKDVKGEYYAPLSGKWIYLSITVTNEGVIMLFYDITETKKAAQELLKIKDLLAQRATDKYLTLFNSINQGFCVIEMIYDEKGVPVNYKLVEANPVFEHQTGIRNAIGKTVFEFSPQAEIRLLKKYGEIVKTGASKHFEYHAPHLAGGVWYEIFAFRFGNAADKQVAILFNDITERKRRESNYAFITEWMHGFSQLTTPDEIIQYSGDRIGEYLHISNINFLDIDISQEEEITVSYCWTKPGVQSLLGKFRMSDYLTKEFEITTRKGEIIVINDTTNDGRIQPSVARQFQVGAFVGVPFFQQGEWRYYLSITDTKARNWRKDEIELIQEVTNRIFPRLEKARVEEALRNSEKKYRTLFETMDEGFAICELIRDPNGVVIDFRFLEFNPSLEKHTGLKVDETIGQLASEVAPGLDEYWYQAFQHVADYSESRRLEHYVPQLNRWLDVMAYHFGDDQIMVLYDDVSERKKAELALRESEENFRAMFNVSSVGQAQADAHSHKLLRVNAALCRITGYSEEELLNMTVDQLNYPDDRGKDHHFFKQLPSEHGNYQVEKRYLKKDGSIVWVNVTGDIIRDADGKPLRTVAVIQDITQRKKTEEQFRKFNELLEKQVAARTKDLHESRELLHSMLEKTSSSIMMLKPVFNSKNQIVDFHFVFANRQALHSVGLETVPTKGLGEIFPGVLKTDFFRQYMKVVRTGEDWNDEVHIDFGGVNVWIHVYASLVNENLLITYYDITERKNADLKSGSGSKRHKK